MQYLLTDREYRTLIEGKAKKEAEIEENLFYLCVLAALNVEVEVTWHDKPIVWGCPETKRFEGRLGIPIYAKGEGMEYCDECPVKDICPYKYKHWSK
jgi:hypothetical protein